MKLLMGHRLRSAWFTFRRLVLTVVSTPHLILAHLRIAVTVAAELVAVTAAAQGAVVVQAEEALAVVLAEETLAVVLVEVVLVEEVLAEVELVVMEQAAALVVAEPVAVGAVTANRIAVRLANLLARLTSPERRTEKGFGTALSNSSKVLAMIGRRVSTLLPATPARIPRCLSPHSISRLAIASIRRFRFPASVAPGASIFAVT